MRNDYNYIDPDYTYTYPETGVLRNKENIDDAVLLLNFESFKTSERLEELHIRPITIEDSGALFAIHRHLFQDVYSWAGQKRRVEISKGGKSFFPLSHFDTALVYIDSLVAEFRSIDKKDAVQIAKKLAEILDRVNYLHPFREGNGRTQREFLRLLALEKEYTLNLNPADDADVYECYMSGTIDADVEKLTALIWAEGVHTLIDATPARVSLGAEWGYVPRSVTSPGKQHTLLAAGLLILQLMQRVPG